MPVDGGNDLRGGVAGVNGVCRIRGDRDALTLRHTLTQTRAQADIRHRGKGFVIVGRAGPLVEPVTRALRPLSGPM